MPSLQRSLTPTPRPPWEWRNIASSGAPRVLLSNLARPFHDLGELDVAARLYQVVAPSFMLFSRQIGGHPHLVLGAATALELYPSALWWELVDEGAGIVYRATFSRPESITAYRAADRTQIAVPLGHFVPSRRIT